MERLGKPRHRRAGRRPNEREANESISRYLLEKVRDVSASLDMTKKTRNVAGGSVNRPTKRMTRKQKAYAQAGVDVDLGNQLKRGIHQLVCTTHGPQVLGTIGGFGGLFAPNFRGVRAPVLVASVDGVGTKLKIAFAMNRHDTVGTDLVNHCVNDIAVFGARPLFFLDYIGAEKLHPRVFYELLRGFTRACRAAKCALIGGER